MTTGYDFRPKNGLISAITKGQNTLVTLTENHFYTLSEIVSFRISKDSGMVQLNNKYGKIVSLTDDTITVDIDSLDFNSYIHAGEDIPHPAMVIPAASGIIEGQIARTTLQDVFDNVPTN